MAGRVDSVAKERAWLGFVVCHAKFFFWRFASKLLESTGDMIDA
jgi:hypothetical protein